MNQDLEPLWWVISLGLMFLGLLGTFIPVLPDSLLILLGAMLHHFLIPPAHTVGWVTLSILIVLTIVAHVVDFVGGAVGAQRFGASQWGAWGGFIGAIVGIFLFPIGLFLGPVIGVLVAEILIAGKELGPALHSSWGSLLGTVGAMIAKVVIDISMIIVFFLGLIFRF